jgi:hypothetical protein
MKSGAVDRGVAAEKPPAVQQAAGAPTPGPATPPESALAAALRRARERR